MNSRHVTTAQAATIHAKLVETSRYLYWLRERMTARAFSPDDPVFRTVFMAQSTMADLAHELHKLAYPGAYGPKIGSNGERKPR